MCIKSAWELLFFQWKSSLLSNMVGERGRRKGKKGRGEEQWRLSFSAFTLRRLKKNLLSTMGQQYQNAMDRFINIRGIKAMLVHCITLIPFRLIRKNLGNLREFFGQMAHRLPRQKIARTSKNINIKYHSIGWKRSFKSVILRLIDRTDSEERRQEFHN